jgi:hypothetical protein
MTTRMGTFMLSMVVGVILPVRDVQVIPEQARKEAMAARLKGEAAAIAAAQVAKRSLGDLTRTTFRPTLMEGHTGTHIMVG